MSPTKNAFRFLRALRVRAVAFLAGSIALVFVAAGVLVWGAGQAGYYIDRAAQSERQQEILILLSARAGDHAFAIMDAVHDPSQGRTRLAASAGETNAVFDLIERSIESQTALSASPESRNAEATESLGVARMRAILQQLDRSIFQLLERTGKLEGSAAQDDVQTEARTYVTVFGITFTPLLSQAVERERREALASRDAMAELRAKLREVAAVLVFFAILFAASLYFLALRPIASRLRDTSKAMTALTQGALSTRVALRGRDELTVFMTRFNRMAGSFARRQRDLRRAQDRLQDIVAARTAELEAANARLNTRDADRRRFFADISHELRTPLTVIRGEAEMTLRLSNAVLSEDTRASLETIATRAIRLNRRIDDMLRVARSESGRIELAHEAFDVALSLEAAVEDALPLARQKNIEIVFASGPGGTLCSGDKDWLRQVFSGLLANAIKYAGAGTSIMVRCVKGGGDVLAEVSDEGCGLDADELVSVFERFERGRPPSHEGLAGHGRAGHGMGLALAKWIVGEHGGNIRLESPGRLWKNNGTQKRGLTAFVSLPAIAAQVGQG